MKKGAAILLVLYGIMMLSYGSLEMTHDLLHYLAEHNHSHLHSHEHTGHHDFSDHQQPHIAHDHHTHFHHQDNEDEPASELPSLIHFFFFCEPNLLFSFHNTSSRLQKFQQHIKINPISYHPITPPPQC